MAQASLYCKCLDLAAINQNVFSLVVLWGNHKIRLLEPPICQCKVSRRQWCGFNTSPVLLSLLSLTQTVTFRTYTAHSRVRKHSNPGLIYCKSHFSSTLWSVVKWTWPGVGNESRYHFTSQCSATHKGAKREKLSIHPSSYLALVHQCNFYFFSSSWGIPNSSQARSQI